MYFSDDVFIKEFLSEEEIASLRQQHKKERDKRVCDRIKAILLRDQGWTWMQISAALLLSEEVLRQHLKDYKASKKLKPENGGSQEKLSSEQNTELQKHLESKTYLYVKDIVSYVQQTYGVSYTVYGMFDWLKRNQFSYKKPALVPGKANKKAQEDWIKAYHELKGNLPEDESLCFVDGVHPTHNVQLAYGWIRKGFRKEIPSNTGRQRINLTGAVDIQDQQLHFREDLTLNAESSISFFKEIEEAYPTKKRVHLVVDNARYYKNKAVTEYLKTSKVTLHFLPPYSPNLNPIERLWKWMKQRVLYNTYYSTIEKFKGAVFDFLNKLKNLSSEPDLRNTFAGKIRDRFRPIGSPL